MKELRPSIEEIEAGIDDLRERFDFLCDCCHQFFAVSIRGNDLRDWQNGKLAQYAFPYLTDDERELIISRTCETCFDDLADFWDE